MKSKKIRMELDIKKLGQEVIYNIWRIILAGVFFALCMMTVSELLLPEQYESTTKMYVLAKQSETAVTNGDMEASTALTKDYAELIRSRTVMEKVILQENMNLTYEELLKQVTVVTPVETRIISITVLDTDPYEAARLANAIRDVAAEHIKEVMNTESVNVVDKANIPMTPQGPGTMVFGLIGGIVGVFLALLAVLGAYLLDDTIKSSEDIENYLGIGTLGVIPKTRKKR